MRALTCILTLAGLLAGNLHAADKPLRALLITGGCCNDYAKQKDILKQGLERRINIVIDQAHSEDKSTKPPLPIFGKPHYAKGYDIIIHDDCAAGISDADIIAGVLAPHRKGVPGVNLHCAMHSYPSSDFRKSVKPGADNAKWFEYIGLQSTSHGPQQPIEIKFEKNVPYITKGVENWTTQREELYNNVQVLPNVKVVARGVQGNRKAVVAWTNDYNGTRVFSTSIGHNNVTVANPRYLNLFARGILWAVNREYMKVSKPKNESFDLSNKQKPKSAGGKKNAKNSVPLKAATGKKVTASYEESNKGNLAKYAVDGQTPKGPHLADIGKRYKTRELIQSILNPNAIVAQGFDTYSFTLEDNSMHLGFVTLENAVTISIRNAAGVAAELPAKQIKKREKIPASSMPPGLVAGLNPKQLADLLVYLDTI